MKTILITEDSSTMRALIASTIESMGAFEIVQAANGFDALRLLPRGKIDLIITDINMPDINGLELISYVRNNPAYDQVPLIIISTEGSDKDREKGLSLGANEYLVKPFNPAQLIQLVSKYLQ